MFNIGKDYYGVPSGRKYEDGPYSGEKFRKEYLVPMLRHNRVDLYMDDVTGYSSSWLDEVFGGLVRYDGYTRESLSEKLGIRTSDPALYQEIYDYIDSTSPCSSLVLASSTPRLLTGSHEPTKYQKWYLWQKADSSFTQLADISKFGTNLPVAPLGWQMDTSDTLILKCKNVHPHTDDWVGQGSSPAIRRSLFWLVDCKSPLYFGTHGYNAVKMKAGNYVVFDDTVEHYVMSDKLWVGCAWQLDIKGQQ